MKTCKWTFLFKDHGHLKYQTECGLVMYIQRYGIYCPHCGRLIQKERKDDKPI